MTPDVLVKQRAVGDVLEEEVFFLAGKFLSGHDPPVQGTEKFPVSGTDREPFDRDTVDLSLSGRIIIPRPVSFKVFNAGRPALHRHPSLMEVFYGSPGLGLSPSRDIR